VKIPFWEISALTKRIHRRKSLLVFGKIFITTRTFSSEKNKKREAKMNFEAFALSSFKLTSSKLAKPLLQSPIKLEISAKMLKTGRQPKKTLHQIKTEDDMSSRFLRLSTPRSSLPSPKESTPAASSSGQSSKHLKPPTPRSRKKVSTAEKSRAQPRKSLQKNEDFDYIEPPRKLRKRMLLNSLEKVSESNPAAHHQHHTRSKTAYEAQLPIVDEVFNSRFEELSQNAFLEQLGLENKAEKIKKALKKAAREVATDMHKMQCKELKKKFLKKKALKELMSYVGEAFYNHFGIENITVMYKQLQMDVFDMLN